MQVNPVHNVADKLLDCPSFLYLVKTNKLNDLHYTQVERDVTTVYSILIFQISVCVNNQFTISKQGFYLLCTNNALIARLSSSFN